MRAYTSLLCLVPSLLLACGEDKDPLDSLSGDPGTSGGPGTSTTADTTDPETTGATTSTSTSTSTTDSTTSTTSSSTTDVTITTTTTADPSTTSTTTTTTGDPGDPYDGARQLCVDTINMYRATLGLPPYARWTDAESCSDDEALSDGQSGTPHGAFGMCGEFAQNECPGWPAPPENSLPGCLAQMWAEGPGEDFNMHGHYINMSSEQYTRVACGFAEVGGEMWMVQNFQ